MKIKFKTKEPILEDNISGIPITKLFEDNDYMYQVIEEITSEQRRMLYDNSNILTFIVDRENSTLIKG